MQKKMQQFGKDYMEQLITHGAGHDILRFVSIPELLGEDSSSILYVLGKKLARQVKPASMEEIEDFFIQMGWGNLNLVKQKRHEITFELSGAPIVHRWKVGLGQEYRLEAGFLAASIEQIKELVCECVDENVPKKEYVQFNVYFAKED
ncbi:YslB family protein [Terribacillus saccharophilus]|uniref:YslB family protein n=1 Tax=Terribacillus saccharophilus TaxID=361277 RepID=UPI0039821EBF